jgi:dihydrolipoamide dehydrogenase
MNDYQLIILGTGPGGTAAAFAAAKRGWKTALVEESTLGGTCLNRGCVPTKTLLHTSQLYAQAQSAAGLESSRLHLDLSALFARKCAVTDTLRSSLETSLSTAGIEVLHGHGTILRPGCVAVGEKQYSAAYILVATGAVPAQPPIPGLKLPGVLTSDALLSGEEQLWDSLVIIGGGVIGVEFACFYAALGCRVTVLEGLDRLLPAMERELGQNLALQLKKENVAVYTGAMVSRIESAEDGLHVYFQVKGAENSAVGARVLCAVGRRPNLSGVFAAPLSPALDGGRLAVNAQFETSIPGIYAIGDVCSKIQLAHVSAAQGTAFVAQLCGEESPVQLALIPSCVYCSPEIASVGITEAEAKAAGLSVKIGRCALHSNARTLICGTGRSFIKLVADAQNHALLGAQLMCHNSSDMIGGLAQAIANQMTVEQLLLAMRPHPTFEEAMTQALEDLKAKLSQH